MRPILAFVLLGTAVGALGCQTFRRDPTAIDDYNRTLSGPEVSQADSDAGVRGLGSSGVRDIEPVSYEEPDDDGFTIDDLSPQAIGASAKKAIGQGPNREKAKEIFLEADEQYEEALRLQQSESTLDEAKKLFRKSAERYLAAGERFPNSSLEQDALFQAGEAYFFADNYDKSNETFEKLIADYAGTRYLDRAEARRFAIARYWLELDEVNPDALWTYNFTNKERPSRDTDGHARRVLNGIRLDDPSGRLADDATMALGNAYFRDKSYLDAADTYEDLRQTFPGSEHVFNASLLEIRARIEAYRGPAYDGTGVKKADALLKSVVSQFPYKVDEQKAALDELAAEVRYHLADREMSLGRLYERRREMRAAKLHYHKVVSDYGDTQLADEARERLARIADAPDLPPQRLKWLVDILPAPKDQKPLFNDDVPR